MKKNPAFLLAAAALILTLAVTAATSAVQIDSAAFPDEVFREYVADSFDTDGNGVLSDAERETVTEMDVSSKGIQNFGGIEYFPCLTSLDCYENSLTELDLSGNPALTYLDCSYNSLTELDLSGNLSLTYLDCSANSLTSLDVSKNTALTDLECDENRLVSLDVSKNTALLSLFCSDNSLTALDLSNNTALERLYCEYNRLTSLDLSENHALFQMNAYSNDLTALDLTETLICTREWKYFYSFFGDQNDGGTISVTMTKAQMDMFSENGADEPNNARVAVILSGGFLHDVDADGDFDTDDFTALCQYVSGVNITVEEAAADVNGDGEITASDAQCLWKLLHD